MNVSTFMSKLLDKQDYEDIHIYHWGFFFIWEYLRVCFFSIYSASLLTLSYMLTTGITKASLHQEFIRYYIEQKHRLFYLRLSMFSTGSWTNSFTDDTNDNIFFFTFMANKKLLCLSSVKAFPLAHLCLPSE